MEHTVTGCIDCPLYDSAQGEYNRWCHHPDRPIRVLRYDGTPGVWNWPEAELPKEVFDTIRKENGFGLLDFLKKYENDNDVHLRIDEPGIEDDPEDHYSPITPDWCPLNKEPITIIKK